MEGCQQEEEEEEASHLMMAILLSQMGILRRRKKKRRGKEKGREEQQQQKQQQEEEDAQQQASMACPSRRCPSALPLRCHLSLLGPPVAFNGRLSSTWISGALHLLSSKGEHYHQCNP